jgi:outer membrane protein
MRGSSFRSTLVAILAGLLANGVPAFGQSQGQAQEQPARQLQKGPDYSLGPHWVPNFIAPYSPIHIDLPQLTNSPRIDQLIQDGKLMLSLQDAISLALENNLDISVQRYNPWIAETDLLRAKAGGAVRGLSGTGTASVLGAIPSATFDPVLSSTLSWSRASFPVNNPFTSGVGLTQLSALTNYSAQGNVTYSEGFHTGTAFSISLANNRTSTTSPAAILNPAVSSQLNFSVQQQLLNGFGLLPNTRFILEAKNNRRIADYAFQQQVHATVAQVENLYWELVFARENVKVQQAAVATSGKLYNDNKRQVEIGTLAPIEVVRAESEVATGRQALIVAETGRLQQQALLLNAITKNPVAPELLNVEVVPTDTVQQTPQVELISLQDAVKEAWQKRPEILQAQYNLKNADVEIRATRNALLPILTLLGQYGAAGLGGNSKVPLGFTTVAGAQVVNATGQPQPNFFLPVNAATGFVLHNGGLGDALDSVINNNFPNYSVALNLTIPIRNRSAQADSARAQLQQRQLETSYRQLENTIVVDVRNAQIALQQDVARVEAAQKARELAQQTLDAEQKKYQLGVSTSFLVIQTQRDLTTAEGNELRAKVDLQEAIVNFQKAVGRTLEINRITIADAQHGHFYNSPLIPGTPSVEVVGDIAR